MVRFCDRGSPTRRSGGCGDGISQVEERSDRVEALQDLCDEVRWLEQERHPFEEPSNEFMASMIVLDDAISAINGHRTNGEFSNLSEAYLAKFRPPAGTPTGLRRRRSGQKLGVGLRLRTHSVPGGRAVFQG